MEPQRGFEKVRGITAPLSPRVACALLCLMRAATFTERAIENSMSISEQRTHGRFTMLEAAAVGQSQQSARVRTSPSVEELLAEVQEGSPRRLNRLTAVLYRELQRLAKRHLFGQHRGHTLRTSDLVNETYLKLASLQAPEWKDRAHFLSVASRAMRSILVDYARRRSYAKRGGGAVRLALSSVSMISDQFSVEVLAVNEALARLSQLAPRTTQIVELRYFAGFSLEETAEAMELSTGTVKREWNMAKAWLRRELAQQKAV